MKTGIASFCDTTKNPRSIRGFFIAFFAYELIMRRFSAFFNTFALSKAQLSVAYFFPCVVRLIASYFEINTLAVSYAFENRIKVI